MTESVAMLHLRKSLQYMCPAPAASDRLRRAAVLLLAWTTVSLATNVVHARRKMGSTASPSPVSGLRVLPTYTDQPVDASSQRILPPSRHEGRGSVWVTVIRPGNGSPNAMQPQTFDDISPAPTLARAALSTRAVRREAFEPLIKRVADAHGIDTALLLAIVDVESGFDAKAISPKGARGLAQVTPATAARYGRFNLFSPEENLTASSLYLRDLLKLFGGDLRLAVAAYNAGEAAVQRYDNRVPPFTETRQYVPAVLAQYRQYRKEQRLIPGAASAAVDPVADRP